MDYTHYGCPRCPHRLFGIVVCLLATVCFALGIADAVYTYSVYCYSHTPACSSVEINLTWVAVGIWASVPVFLTGLSALWLKGHRSSVRAKNKYLLLCSISALLFTPALLIVSAVEVWLGRNVFYNFPPSGPTGNDVTKLSIPLTIAVLGAVLFLLISAALVWECCDSLPWIQTHHQQDHEDERDTAWRKPGHCKRCAVDNSVYVLEIPIVGKPAPQAPCTGTQCEQHGSSQLHVNSYSPCQACMERSRRGVGHWSWASPA